MGVSVNPSTYPMTLSHQISKKTDPYFNPSQGQPPEI